MHEQHFDSLPGHIIQIRFGIVSSDDTSEILCELLDDAIIRDRIACILEPALRRELNATTTRQHDVDVVWLDPDKNFNRVERDEELFNS